MVLPLPRALLWAITFYPFRVLAQVNELFIDQFLVLSCVVALNT